MTNSFFDMMLDGAASAMQPTTNEPFGSWPFHPIVEDWPLRLPAAASTITAKR